MQDNRNSENPMQALNNYLQRAMFNCINEGHSDLDIKMKIQDAINDILRDEDL
jgi:hypothetical protein